MPTNEQRRQAAKRKLERQQERRLQRSQRRKRTAALTAIIVVVAVVAAGIAVSSIGGSTPPTTAPVAAPPGACAFQQTLDDPAVRPVSSLPNGNPPTQGTVPVTVTTNQGVLPITLDRSAAPCTVESFVHLATSGFYNDTPCHRLVAEDTLKVLQCGDPTGTGTGGPGYSIPDEPPSGLTPASPGTVIYPRGTVAMAKAMAPNSGGSQFFLVYADSQLPPDYTVFGRVAEPGIAVLEKIASAGDDGAYASSAGGGRPNTPVTLQTVNVAQP